ncbi:divalent-cation tolerance protein CutA [Paramagnetospirillum kuznetsovii]|uniref:Divalent-cation tolerance protein CutA n=1 Tax=Paramagnetospirillum kuznetsovii TaxID=2053833 RepID=A0A364P036_9PROT|nr:divalent-cation tolerance protein CutA [Paramagnetospirillum kuznetsovii]RAU22527.1 divalent-cation tolerance protein CutA [Paramagnetospirillum kuznetsovii]
MDRSLIYIAAPDRDAALALARALVEARLVACANVMDGATSLYWWDGKIAEDSEVVMICKTRTALVEAVVAKVKELHSYDCPCVVALPITGGNPAFLDWIGAECLPGKNFSHR